MSFELHVLQVNVVQINLLNFYYNEVLFYQVHKICNVWTITFQFQRFTFIKFLNYYERNTHRWIRMYFELGRSLCVVTREQNSPTAAHAGCKRQLKWALSAWGYSWATLHHELEIK